MIEAIAPRKTTDPSADAEQAQTPKIVITDNLQALRKIQYETIEQLCNLRMVLTGENCQDTINALDENAVDTLMNLTATICQQGAVINKFVKECRVLIDKHDAPDEDVLQLRDEILYLCDSIDKGYVSYPDIRRALREEHGTEVVFE